MVKRTWFITLALSLSVGIGAALAQQRPITGKVTSSASGQPVAGATVTVPGTPVIAVTNDRGSFPCRPRLGRRRCRSATSGSSISGCSSRRTKAQCR